MTDGNITIFPEADATHMDLLSGATLILSRSGRVSTSARAKVALISVVPSLHCLTSALWTRNAGSSSSREPCSVVGGRQCTEKGHVPEAGQWSSPLRNGSSRRLYLQCLLRLDQLWEMGIVSIWSGETASLFCAFVARQHRRAQSRAQQCPGTCYVMVQMTACQHQTWRTCQNQRPSPWSMHSEMRISTPPMKSWSAGRTLLSTRCHQAMTSSKQSNAHTCHHQHVRLILRNLLAFPFSCRGISEGASCDTKTVRRCGCIGVSFCKCTASSTDQRAAFATHGASRACG